MNEELKFPRADEDDPKRCQGQASEGQCMMLSIEGSEYCKMHGGNHATKATEKLKVRNLQLNKYKLELQRLGNNDNIMSLRDEIALVRLLLEKCVNGIKNDSELLIAMPTIADLTYKVEKLVSSCHKIEEKTGQLLSIEQLGAFAVKIIDVVNKEVKDPEAKEAIAKAIMVAVQERDET